MRIPFMRRAAMGTVTALLLTLALPIGSPAAAQTGEPGEYEISDAYAKAFVMRTTGRTDVVAAMGTRMRPAAADRASGPVFYRTIYSSPPMWAGWMVNQGSSSTKVHGAFSDFYAQNAGGSGPAVGSWVGVGGFGNCWLAQTGVNSQTMKAFYELLNANGQCNTGSTPVFSVTAGDHMWSYVTYDGGTGTWFLMVQDITQSLYYSNEWSYSTNTNTAEYITEAYGAAVPASMPTVHFWTARWVDWYSNTYDLGVGAYDLVKIIDQDPYGGCVVPTDIYGTGNNTFDNAHQYSC